MATAPELLPPRPPWRRLPRLENGEHLDQKTFHARYAEMPKSVKAELIGGTVYGFIDRQNLPGMFRTFDFASPDTHAPQRFSTTVPQQALFLMNSPFVVQQAQALTARPEVAQASSPEQRVEVLYRLLYGRPPQTDEVELGLRFVRAATPAAETKLSPWEQYAQVLLLANEFAFVD